MAFRAVQMKLSGALQGMGVRPQLARMAMQHSWSGSVRNTLAGIDLILAGDLPEENVLKSIVRNALPIHAITIVDELPVSARSAQTGFRIEESELTGAISAPIPCDVAICSECLSEVSDSTNRRFRFPFISCAHCGPRYTILRSMPFDRRRTTLDAFPMCSACFEEYHDPWNRRFHAQTIGCAECGPRLWACVTSGPQIAVNDEALRLAAAGLIQGQIVALKGIGGYQLLADACRSDVVRKLRQRKHRPEKPFAVMCRNLAEARKYAIIGEQESEEMQSAANPIVLLRRIGSSGLADELFPGLNDIGILLPTTAIHDRLLEIVGGPLVCTSGNESGGPIAYRNNEAEMSLGNIADLFLHHDRDIARPVDDSVVRVLSQRSVTFRMGRGLAPLKLELGKHVSTFALGAHEKSAVAMSNGCQSILGPYIGDLETIPAQDRWIEQARELEQLLNPAQEDCPLERNSLPDECRLGSGESCYALDPHPDYYPSRWRHDDSGNELTVWHHHAHIVSGMVEHGWLDRTVLGVAFDGTGLGPDGSIWGGEFLITTATGFRRVGSLRPFQMPGGTASMIDLRRLLFSLLTQIEGLSSENICNWTGLSLDQIGRFTHVLASRYSVPTTSCGRLFDAVACLILGIHRSEFDGHAAMALEAACDSSSEGRYRFAISPGPPFEIDWRPVISQMIVDRAHGDVTMNQMAMRFHRAVAHSILDVARQHPDLPIVLSGGVFQNRVLVELLVTEWPRPLSELGLPGRIPPNDGGIAAGQLAIAQSINSMKDESKCA